MRYSTQDVAVIIPAYNCEAVIDRALHSVFSQTEQPGEVIVVNDGSTDNTDQVIRQSRYFGDIRYLVKSNGGPAAARNFALEKTEKAWAAFLDADDLWIAKDKLARQIELANQHPAATLIDGFSEVHWHKQAKVRQHYVKKIKSGPVFERFLFENAVNATSSVLARMDLVREVGGFPEDIRYGEDRLLWAMLAQRGEVHTLQDVVIKKVNEAGNLTSFNDKNYHYRLMCIRFLLELGNVSAEKAKAIWYRNLQEPFRAAMRANNPRQYGDIFGLARQHSGNRVLFSRHFLINAYGKLFGSFNLLNRMWA